jgi:hypothetical protein
MRTQTKYNYHPDLFTPEPPDDPSKVKSLFCGRERELRRGLETLRSHMDLKGRWSAGHGKRPWIVHGESRAGKSHLARRILADLQSGADIVTCVIPARERLQAAQVMSTLFERIASEFTSRQSQQSLLGRLLKDPEVEVVQDIVDRVQALSTECEGIDLTFTEATRTAFEAGGDMTYIPTIFKILAKVGREQSDGKTTVFKLRRPNAEDYARYCAIVIDILARKFDVNEVLVLVDDVDLLEGYSDQNRNGRVERSILAAALIRLHQCPCTDVIVTSRSWYAHSTKEFKTLVNLLECEEMNERDLIAIHNRRWDEYCQGQPAGFLSHEALSAAAGDVRGLPGVFLQHLDTAFRNYQDEDEWGERTYDWYLGIFRRLFSRLDRSYPEAAERIRMEVRNGRQNIDMGDRNLFHKTMFDNEFVFQSYYGETLYYVDALTAKII